MQRSSQVKNILPADFQLNKFTVICGREKEQREFVGNKRFRVIVQTYLSSYSQAKVRAEKTRIVSQVIEIIHSAGGCFVKFEDNNTEGGNGGYWYEVDVATAREKVGSLFRDLLADQYRSSSKNKVARRKCIRRAISTSNVDDETLSKNKVARNKRLRSVVSASNIVDDDSTRQQPHKGDIKSLPSLPLSSAPRAVSVETSNEARTTEPSPLTFRPVKFVDCLPLAAISNQFSDIDSHIKDVLCCFGCRCEEVSNEEDDFSEATHETRSSGCCSMCSSSADEDIISTFNPDDVNLSAPITIDIFDEFEVTY